MSDLLKLEVITPADTALRVEVRDVYVPAVLGEAGILEHHLPYLSLLNAGEVSYLDAGGQRRYLYIGAGFLEVRGGGVTIVTDSVRPAEEIDAADVQRRLQQSEARVKSAARGEITPDELERELKNLADLRCQLDVARQAGKK